MDLKLYTWEDLASVYYAGQMNGIEVAIASCKHACDDLTRITQGNERYIIQRFRETLMGLEGMLLLEALEDLWETKLQ